MLAGCAPGAPATVDGCRTPSSGSASSWWSWRSGSPAPCGAPACADRASLERVVAPVHQRVAPLRVLLVVLRAALRGVPVHVADDLPHRRDVVVGQVTLLRPEDPDDPAALLVARRLALAAGVADRLRLVRLQPLLELVRGHVDGLLPVVPHVVDALLLRHASRLATAAPHPLNRPHCTNDGAPDAPPHARAVHASPEGHFSVVRAAAARAAGERISRG